jgi:hypothetical protein
MEGIYETNAAFPFSQLVLTSPAAISGGNYFIKYVMNGKPLYIQTPTCKTRDGVSKSGKRNHSDLMFTQDNEDFIRWMEELETHSCKYIFERREKWFETEMEMSDIENYFVSPLKIYKSGKFYIARTNIPTRLGKVTLKIYDENEREVDPESITTDTCVETILEVQGIKCSARSFQIELELKQMLVVQPTNLFEKCLLTRGESIAPPPAPLPSLPAAAHTLPETVVDAAAATAVATAAIVEDVLEKEDITSVVEIEDSVEEGMEAIELSLEELPIDENIQIKNRTDVYHEMYREARKRAKEARDAALAAYLEAKHIKQTYQLDDVSDNESGD